MKRTTNVELLKVAMDYLPLYDLSEEAMSKDYLSCNFGDFLTRFLMRMAFESGTLLSKDDDVGKALGALLGVDKETPKEDAKRKYLALAKIHHPDMPHGNAEVFMQLQKALDDSEAR